MRKKLIWFVGILLICCAVIIAALLARPVTSAAEERIGQTLLSLNAADAVPVRNMEQTEQYDQLGITCDIYESASSGCRYTFNAASGRLLSLQRQYSTEIAGEAMGRGNLRRLVQETIQGLLGDALIGELWLLGESTADGGDLEYVYMELLDGVPTGTSAVARFRADGAPTEVSLTYGSVFTLGEDGSYEMTGEPAALSEAEAIRIALDAAGPTAQERGDGSLEFESCVLRSFRDEVFYEVTMLGAEEGPDHRHKYTQRVDFYTGLPGLLAQCR